MEMFLGVRILMVGERSSTYHHKLMASQFGQTVTYLCSIVLVNLMLVSFKPLQTSVQCISWKDRSQSNDINIYVIVIDKSPNLSITEL